ncbi:S8 family peptidase [Mycolicibacterium tusciae]|uniref:S8 family peptidase n=1 Tax=Mycolicibacterium tusciae TaxID=75922 RepID=UPI001EF8512C|nr:S8 family serine peptidase [Mycolicibacterium tusciae]
MELFEDVPVYPAVARPALKRRKVPRGTPKQNVKIIVKSSSGARLRGVIVTGMMADLTVDYRRTDSKGTATLNASGTELQHVWVDPAPSHWSWATRNVQLTDDDLEVTLAPIAQGHIDGLRQRYTACDLDAGDGVVVGVIDTGVGPHPDLTVQGGRSYPLGPLEMPWTAGDSPHGTHVAGVIASRAVRPRRGIAPGVTLRSYRIYEEDEVGRSYSLSAAVRDAVDDGCDVINLSVELAGNDHLLERRIVQAIAEGVIVVVAAGNGSREPLAFPASIDGVVGVAALGRRRSYPKHAASVYHEAGPPGTDPDDYVAGFSNRVRHDDVAAPGVGTISTLPDGEWGVMDGTSQAAPVVTALVARILAESGLVRQERSIGRAQAVLKELREGNLGLGFPADLVGTGLVIASNTSP